MDYAFETHKLLIERTTKTSCIIAAYNEETRIANVLEIAKSFPLFHEVIVINDGSSDKTQTIIEKFLQRSKHLKVIELKKNLGKTNAILEGVKTSKGELLCFLDADLTNLLFDNIYKMIYFVLNKEYSMTILDRAGDRAAPVGWTQSWIARFNGGERTLWKKDFQKIKFPLESRYALEQIINLHYISHGLRVRTIYCKNLIASLQTEKRGIKAGILAYQKMFIELYKASKLKGLYIQIENIVEDRLEPLYRLMNKSNKKVIKKTSLLMIIVAGLITSTGTFLWLNAKNNINKVTHKRKSRN